MRCASLFVFCCCSDSRWVLIETECTRLREDGAPFCGVAVTPLALQSGLETAVNRRLWETRPLCCESINIPQSVVAGGQVRVDRGSEVTKGSLWSSVRENDSFVNSPVCEF